MLCIILIRGGRGLGRVTASQCELQGAVLHMFSGGDMVSALTLGSKFTVREIHELIMQPSVGQHIRGLHHDDTKLISQAVSLAYRSWLFQLQCTCRSASVGLGCDLESSVCLMGSQVVLLLMGPHVLFSTSGGLCPGVTPERTRR